ncbi:5-enolpyruvylshikimate 3-phosphate synthase [Thermoplasma volcanium GSS1]|uniref:3-phosphoshikimate 1-carboxyvinyltransferase n=2 Tax=Thermoplasma volcanium TaxID=50339 RepID=AROA_THEVO|nr:RecName: Full=3-phosphoshikimate 1-carboxyvinyltransferase; AltName: Full=5-enolpyruvylshikimate-3-phosphate synthase; Short=EPSP synthase; Short=EPSPS [Thermoplasma volcanium GSS1]BAB60484.1 5-enolpyruvylshikimate 3-phosphate synthase [Thermoplasma volcanium GSS1]
MIVKVSNLGGSGIAEMPSSKSFTQRYVLASAFLNKSVVLNGITITNDDDVAMRIAESVGSTITINNRSIKISSNFKCPEEIYVGESGTSYRLSIGLLAASGCVTRIKGEDSLAKRPIEPLLMALGENGVKFERNEAGFYNVDGRNSQKKHVEIEGSSSQFVSSLMLYYAKKGGGEFTARNIKSIGYVYITKRVLYDLGYFANIERTITINPTGVWKTAIDVEPDYSSMAFFMVLGLLSDSVDVRFRIKRISRIQPDSVILDLFKNNILINGEEIRVISGINEPVSVDADMNPDLCPPLSVIGIFSKYGVQIRNYERLKTKESNRYEGIIDLAERFGANVEDNGQDLFIKPGSVRFPDVISYKDHRMIMAASIASLIGGFPTVIENAEKTAKSFPGFFAELSKFANVEELA